MSLLQSVVPLFEQWAKEGEEGRNKINRITRYGTLVLGLVQAVGISAWLESLQVLTSSCAM